MADLKHPLFVDAQFPMKIVNGLRALGYDIETVQQYQGTSRPESGLSDEQVLEVAMRKRRAVLTMDTKDFRSLHHKNPNHRGIIVSRHTSEFGKRAKEIDEVIKTHSPLHGKLIYVPEKSKQG
jgi:predicted nuclease of predicted toxin-antitoxin system